MASNSCQNRNELEDGYLKPVAHKDKSQPGSVTYRTNTDASPLPRTLQNENPAYRSSDYARPGSEYDYIDESLMKSKEHHGY